MECLQVIKEAIPRKTLNKWRFRLVVCWIAVGTVLFGAFSIIESKESRSDFRCDVRDEIDQDTIRDECYDQYLQSHELGIPSYFFILINVSLIPIVTVLYSYRVKSTVSRLERNYQNAEGVLRDRRGSRRLFRAYLFQLVVSIALGITFIALLQTHLLYPTNFLCPNKKFLVKVVLNRTQSTNSFACFYDKAGDKNFCTKFATAANAIYATFALLEILLILKRARDATIFMYNGQFYADYLESNSDEEPPILEAPLVEAINTLNDTINDLQSAIQTLREDCLRGTEHFNRPNGRPIPGEGFTHDLAVDEIYVNVAIHEGRAHHYFATNRWEQLKKYPLDAKDCHFSKLEDIIDKEHTNILVVGRPGIGKTSLSTKLLRLWASGEAFNGNQHFNVVFLLKFRRFNNNANLSLRDLLAAAETVQSLDDAMWDFIKQEPTKVLLIFDGVDEYSRKQEMNTEEDYKNIVEEKMPFSVLYNKLVKGKLLRGASILTTTRPTAVKCVRHVHFQRTVEIRGFTSDDVKEYVKNFTRGNPEAMKKMWEHIKSNINLFSFCYIPMNCFLICHCLLQIILSESSSQALPTKMTDIYKMTVKMFLFNHNREGFSPRELARLKSTHMDQPFDKLPEEFQKILNSLGKIAFKGIEEGRLLFESSEVSELEDCGLLHKLPDLKRKALDDPPKSQFCFTHLTVQEFFAAKHLVDTKTDEGIEEFVWKYINDGTWQMVLQFVAGLLKSSLGSDIFIKLLPKSTEKRENFHSSEPKTMTSWPATKEDKHLAVQVCKCLCEINDEHQPVLQNKIKRLNVNAVEFANCSVAPIDVAAVLHLFEEVLSIDLSLNNLGDLGANEVKKFVVNRERKLKELDVGQNNLTDNAAKDFAAALEDSNCKLEWLDLSHNKFTDNAAKEFAAALQHSNCKLEWLDLSGSEFTDNAAKDFAAALQHSNCKLKSLYLSYNNFNDNAAKDFAAALKHSNCKLKSLDLSDNNFTEGRRRYLIDAGNQRNCKVLV